MADSIILILVNCLPAVCPLGRINMPCFVVMKEPNDKPPASRTYLRSAVAGADVALGALMPRDLHAGYLFGVVGRIDAPCIGYVEEPDIDAFHWVEGPMQPTYRITFYQKDLWEGYQVCCQL